MSTRLVPLLLLFLLCVLFAVAYQPRQPIALDAAAPSSEKFLDGFYPSEHGARWTGARSAVELSGLGGGNLGWRVGVRLSGPRPSGFDAPRVAVRANGETLAEFTAPDEEHDYEWSISPWQLGVKGDLVLEIAADTFWHGVHGPKLGVRVARVWLTRAEGVALPSLKAFALLLALIGSGVLFFSALANAGRRLRFVSLLRNPLALSLGTVWLLVVAGLALDRAETTWWLSIVTLNALFGAALMWLIARITLFASFTRRQTISICGIFALAAFVRLVLDTGQGYEGDMDTYLSLTWKMAHYGFHAAYLDINGVPPSDNPPVLLYPFWLVGWLYQQLIAPLFAPTWTYDSTILRFMLRMPSLAADLLAGALIFRTWRSMSLSFNSAAIAMSVYLLNPALIFDSAYWGQTAAIHILFMLLSLIAIDRRAYGWAGAALTAAVLTKPQALSIAPLVLLLAFRERGLFRFGAAALITGVAICLPFLLTNTIAGAVSQYERVTEYHPFLAVNAHNLWWLLTLGHTWRADTLPIGPLTFRSVGLLLFGCATLFSLLVVWRERRMLFLAAAYQSLAFFMLNTQIHENHLLPMFASLIIAAGLDRKTWWLYGAFTLTALANMALHDPNLFMWAGYPETEIHGGPALALPRWLNAAAQTSLFIVFTCWLIVIARRGVRPPARV